MALSLGTTGPIGFESWLHDALLFIPCNIKVIKVMMVIKVVQVIQVIKVINVIKVIKVIKVMMVIKVVQVIKVMMVIKVVQVIKVIKVINEIPCNIKARKLPTSQPKAGDCCCRITSFFLSAWCDVSNLNPVTYI